MCIQDLQLGRGRQAGPALTFTSDQNSALIPDARRVAILVSWVAPFAFDSAGAVTFFDTVKLVSGPVATATPFFSAGGYGGHAVLRIEDLGQLITGTISVRIVSAFAFSNITIQSIFTNETSPPIP